MRYGNITLNSCSSEDNEEGICVGCLEEAEAGPIDNSFDDHFGTVSDWGWGTSCCECEVAEGKIWLDKVTEQKAAKNYGHERRGEFVVDIHKGERYRKRIVKGYYVNPETGEHEGIFKVERSKIRS